MASASPTVPQLVVLDLDACVWLPEMYQLPSAPASWDEIERGVITQCGKAVIRLFPGALHALHCLATEPRFAATRLALASSTSEPGHARETLRLYRLRSSKPGASPEEWESFASRVSFAELYPIQHKEAHFKAIQKQSGVAFSQMLFLDDCTWSDNCGQVARACPGVVGLATPDGITVERWETALRLFAEASAKREAAGETR